MPTESDIIDLLKDLPNSMASIVADGRIWDSDAIDPSAPPRRGEATLAAQDLAGFLTSVRSGFGDMSVSYVDGSLVVQGNTAGFRYRFEGTNDGWFPPVGITGRRVVLEGSAFATYDDKRITRLWTHWNCARALAQLGVRPHMRPDPK